MQTKHSLSKLSQLSKTQEGTFKSFDGTQLWYRSVGEGPILLCCNGLGCSTFYFNFLVDYFKQDYQVIIWDYRGHGQSEYPALRKNHSIDALVKDLKALIDTLKISDPILVGHSMGVQVLLEFYARYPEKIKALISCFGTFGKPIDTFYNSSLSKYAFEGIYIFNQLFPGISKMIGRSMVKNPLWFQVGGLLKMMQPYLADRAIMEQYVNHIVKVDPVFLSNLTRSLQEHSAEDSLKKIKVPTLILGAEEDTFTPVWVSKKMHHLIPKSELFIVKKGTHVALVEQPELINLRIEKFILENVLKKPTGRQRAKKIPLQSIRETNKIASRI